MLIPGTKPLPSVNSCKNGEQYGNLLSAYRLIPYSSCEGGIRLDHGTPYVCPRSGAHGVFFWMIVVLIPFAFTALVGYYYYYYRRSGLARGLVFGPFFYSFAYIQTLTLCIFLQNHPSKLGLKQVKFHTLACTLYLFSNTTTVVTGFFLNTMVYYCEL